MDENRKQDHVNHDDHDHANDNAKRAVAPAPAGGALISLTALSAVLNGVDTTSVVGSVIQLLQFLSREGGLWTHGRKRDEVEDGSTWAVNPTPMSLKWGYICFDNNNKVIGERLVPVSQPKPNVTELPDLGYPWHEQWAANLKCLSGIDAGTEVTYKPTTVGGKQAIAGLIEAVRDRLNGGMHDDKVVPIVRLEKDSYQHSQYGRVYTPVLTIVGWMPLGGPTPPRGPGLPFDKPTPPLTEAEQPRRRRVA
jgi:hypothetical protein